MSYFEKSINQYFIVFGLAVLLYANSVYHGFVLDDDVVIVRNGYVHQGWRGIPDIFAHDSFAGFERVGEGESLLEGGRYRPLSLAAFAVLYSIFGDKPLGFHLFNILMYAGCGLLLLRLLKRMFEEDSKSSGWIPFIIVLLFVSHPVHTEVVDNIKSADEILALLFGLSAMLAAFKSLDDRSIGWMVLSGIAFLLACLAKENATALVLMIPVAFWYFRKIKVSTILVHSIPLIVGLTLFLFIRNAVVGNVPQGSVMHDPLNQPFLEWNGQGWEKSEPGAKAATILYTFGRYAGLMVVPFSLTHDYYPFHIQLQSFVRPFVIISLLILIAMFSYGFFSLKKRDIGGYGILFFLGTLSITANIFFPVGTFMAERFLFLPSVGFILAVVIFIFQLWGSRKIETLVLLFGAVVFIFSFLTVTRNSAWKSNESLFRSDIHHSSNSAKLQNNLGTLLLDQALVEKDTLKQKDLLREALPHLKKATELHPTYYDAYLAYGACAYYLGKFEQSVSSYRTSSRLFPQDEKSKIGLWYALQAYGHDQWTRGDSSVALLSLEEAWSMQADTLIAKDLSRYYHIMGNKEKEVEWKVK